MPFNNNTIYPFNSSFNEVAGVYGVTDASRTVIYIGKTDNLRRRHGEHCADVKHLMHRHAPVGLVFENISNEYARNIREHDLIAEYNPLCNQRL